MRLSKRIAAGAMTAALGAGGLAGAALFAPGVSGAQTQAPATATEDGRHKKGHAPLAAAAEVIGIDVETLREALKDGQTIADVAQANGVDPQTVIDALVAKGLERLEEMRQALPDRMRDLVNGEFEGPPFRGHPRPFAGPR